MNCNDGYEIAMTRSQIASKKTNVAKSFFERTILTSGRSGIID